MSQGELRVDLQCPLSLHGGVVAASGVYQQLGGIGFDDDRKGICLLGAALFLE